MSKASLKDRKRRRLFGILGDTPAQRWPVPSVFDIYNEDPEIIRKAIQGEAVEGLRA